MFLVQDLDALLKIELTFFDGHFVVFNSVSKLWVLAKENHHFVVDVCLGLIAIQDHIHLFLVKVTLFAFFFEVGCHDFIFDTPLNSSHIFFYSRFAFAFFSNIK